MNLKIVSFAAATLVAGLATAPAQASLTVLGPADLTGQGIGAQFTVLTLQAGAPTTESGVVNFNGSITGDVQPGASQSRTFTFADLALTNASDLRLIVNLSEPGSESPPSVTATNAGAVSSLANSVSLNVYSATGTFLESHTLPSGTVLNQVAGGVGGSGLVLGLTAGEAATLNATIAANAGAEVFTVGATFANAQGGNDVIQASRFTSVAAIPEPETYALMMAGLGVLGFAGEAAQEELIAQSPIATAWSDPGRSVPLHRRASSRRSSAGACRCARRR